MDGFGAMTIALIVGLLAGGAGTAVVLRLRDRAAQAHPAKQPELSDSTITLLGALRLPTFVANAEGSVVWVSPEARALGLSSIAEARIHRLVAAVQRTGGVAVDEPDARVRRTDGTARVLLRACEIEQGFILVFADDVSANDRLTAVRSDFLANISHELKTPVAAIALLAEALAEAADNPAQVRRFAQSLSDEAERMTRLTRDVIELSRIESGERNLEMGVFAIGDAVDDALDENQTLVSSNAIALTVEGELSARVNGDQRMIVTAISNLIENAIQYSRKGSRVAVAIESAKEFVRVSVTDEGAGIAPSDQDRVFERFYRADPSRARGGSGLGLSIVKHTAQVHAGHVSVSSELGRGSVFVLELPRASAAVLAEGSAQ